MRKTLIAVVVLVVLCLAAVAGCHNGQTAEALKGVRDDLKSVRDTLTAAKGNIESAIIGVDDASKGTAEATALAKQDNREIERLQKQLDSPWVRFILWVRHWFHIIAGTYVLVGLVSGILLGRNVAVGFASFVLNEIPFASIFKLIGSIFARKKKSVANEGTENEKTK